jgi:hypothetical protein
LAYLQHRPFASEDRAIVKISSNAAAVVIVRLEGDLARMRDVPSGVLSPASPGMSGDRDRSHMRII